MKTNLIRAISRMLSVSDYIYICGNGGSASAANHFAHDLVKMCGLKAISLCSNEALITALANDNGYQNVFVDQLKVFLKPNDLLITISGSGKSKNIIKALKYAKKNEITTLEFPTMSEYQTMQDIENQHIQLIHSIVKQLC